MLSINTQRGHKCDIYDPVLCIISILDHLKL